MKETIDLLNQYFDKCAHCQSFLQGTCRYPWHKVPSCFLFLFSFSDDTVDVSTTGVTPDERQYRKDDCNEQFEGPAFLNRIRYMLSWKDFYTTDSNPRCYLAALKKFSEKINTVGVYGDNQTLPFYFTRISREGLNLCLSFLDFHFLHHGDNILELIQDAFPDYTRDNGLFKIHAREIAVSSISRANVVTSRAYYKNPGRLPFDLSTGNVVIDKSSNLIPVPLSSTRYNLQGLMDVSLLDLKPVLPEEVFKNVALEKLDWVMAEVNNIFSETYQNEMQGIFGSLGYLDGKMPDKEIKERINSFIDIENVFNSYDFTLLARRFLDLCLYDKSVSPLLPMTVFQHIDVEEMKNMRALFFDKDERINAEKRMLFFASSEFYWSKLADFMSIWSTCRKDYPYDSFVSKNEWETAFATDLYNNKNKYPSSRSMTPISYFANVIKAQKQLKTCLYGALLLTQTPMDAYYRERTILYGEVYDTDIAEMFDLQLTTVQYFTSMLDFKFIRKDETEPEHICIGNVPTEDFRMKVEDKLPTIWAESKEQRFDPGEEFYTEESIAPASAGNNDPASKPAFEFPEALLPAKKYFDALKNAGYLDEEYRWKKNVNGHLSYQAGWASRIIVSVFQGAIKHKDVGELLGFANVGNLANANNTYKNQEIESVFTKASLKIKP